MHASADVPPAQCVFAPAYGKLSFLLTAKAKHVDVAPFCPAVFRVSFFILIYPVIARAYIACYVESHIRHVYTPVSLCEIIGTARVCALVCMRAHDGVRVQAELYRASQIRPAET